MDNKNSNRSIVPMPGGIVSNLTLRARLIARLIGDSRVSPWLKLIPISAVIYLLFPVDASAAAAPVGLIPGISALDDAAILGLASYLFIEFAPTEVVKEHLLKLLANLSNNDIVDNEASHPVTKNKDDDSDIVDGEIREVSTD